MAIGSGTCPHMDETELIDLESSAWEALTTEGAATGFYDRVLATKVLMLLPGGTVIDDRETVVESMGGAPWSSYEMSDIRVLSLGLDAAVVAYTATAVRDGKDYTALFNSTYVREDGEWHMALHQQTPI